MIEKKETISGVVSLGRGDISGELSSGNSVSATLVVPNTPELEVYDGTYEVTPLIAEEVTLETDGKLMRGDVTVHEVPNYQTSNAAGGITFYIGREGM